MHKLQALQSIKIESKGKEDHLQAQIAHTIWDKHSYLWYITTPKHATAEINI